MSTKRLGTGEPTTSGHHAAWELAAEARTASLARALTGETLHAWRITDPAAVDDIVLMVDELITNAIVHGAGPVRLRLRLDGARVVAEVTDDNPAAPGSPSSPPLLDWSEQGRGLLLVAALASEFGCRPEDPGKTVWFTRLLHTANGHTPNGRTRLT
ncbi:ATP-binding protein [Actinomadura fulvescens]|uniref:Histidine kinase/HSP90-like ATPase domain-containing protein n=1 Tax=Actinomadura fulvescens TaxID=46160 RepID=A0ABP6BYN8_9ACTN